FLFFFFQAEDGIRDRNVTGVQTCALPISYELADLRCRPPPSTLFLLPEADKNDFSDALPAVADAMYAAPPRRKAAPSKPEKAVVRSEERRVGKEGRSRGGRET